MRWGGRLSAAIEILEDILTRHRPASEALKDWGKSHRFAGSGDRHAIGTLVYDTLRHKASLAWRMQDDAPRALTLGAVRHIWVKSSLEIGQWALEQHGPGKLSSAVTQGFDRHDMSAAPLWVRGDFPEFLEPSFVKTFAENAAAEGRAMAERAPLDLRCNTLRIDRAKLIGTLSKFAATAGPLSPLCVRIPPAGAEQRAPNVEAEPAHGLGWFEVQDAASQVAALLTGARAGECVADICAGAGGKTLALAAMMENRGEIVAHDADRHRLRPIFERMRRAGATNIDVIPADEAARLDGMAAQFDCLLVDAPCSGSGSWRRKPDAKWRLTPQQLAKRGTEQSALLERAAKLVKPGGRLVYVTCSVLPEENGERIAAFLSAEPAFVVVPYRDQWREAIATEPPVSAGAESNGLLLTPFRHGTDGFFISVLRRAT
jgi:16S rRNA (cytosine967-C5)-methyltransferase